MRSAEHVSIPTRRTLLAGIAATPVIGITGGVSVTAAAAASSPLALYWQERERLIAERQSWGDDAEDERVDKHWDRRFAIQDKITAAIATSRADLQIKAALARDLLADDPDGDEPTLTHPNLLSIFQDVERLLLTGALA